MVFQYCPIATIEIKVCYFATVNRIINCLPLTESPSLSLNSNASFPFQFTVGVTNNDYKGGNFNIPVIFALDGATMSGEAPPRHGKYKTGVELWCAKVNPSISASINKISIIESHIVKNTNVDGGGLFCCVDFNGKSISCGHGYLSPRRGNVVLSGIPSYIHFCFFWDLCSCMKLNHGGIVV